MDLLIVLIALEIIASKFLVSYISFYRQEGAYEEKNPLLKWFLNRLHIKHDEWLSFFCSILLVGLAVFILNSFYNAVAYQYLFIFSGLFTTILNLGAAHSSYFQKTNFITRRLLR
ncbi:hypothetical protein [Salinimicrobium xinjiangense]|uniref:hypothetical protein n=1 Tax=Salinimicrobium xinjiangense TaxID=438596 RepID=UPI000417DE1A|nr:hypothetical protein [Salinimicrobium xinjiangense]